MKEYLDWTTEDLLERYRLLDDSVNEAACENYEKAMKSQDAVELNLVRDILFERKMKEKPLEKMSLLELEKQQKLDIGARKDYNRKKAERYDQKQAQKQAQKQGPAVPVNRP